MTLREAFKEQDIEFRKGTWNISFNGDDETEKCADTLDDLEELWNEFADENDFARDSVDEVAEAYDPYYGGWFSNDEIDKSFVISNLQSLIDNRKYYELDDSKFIVLKAAIEYIQKPDGSESFWVDGPYINE